MRRSKDVLTTGEVAKVCNVAPRTVSKWFDSGKLRGYRIPGSKDRRIPLQELVRFMRAHNMPLAGLESGLTRILIAETDTDLALLLEKALEENARFEVQVVRSAFEAGAAAEASRPHVMLIDTSLSGLSGRDGVRAIRNVSDLEGCKLIAVTGRLQDGEDEEFRRQGYDGVLPKPFDVPQAVRTIEAAIQNSSAG